MSKFDYSSVLVGIIMILLLLIVIVFAMIKFREDFSEKADAVMYQQPTWTEST